MPTIVIKNGERTLKFSKREYDTLANARQICRDLVRDFPDLKEEAEAACAALVDIEESSARKPTTDKPTK